MKKFTRNYNGEPIKANEVMVPFEYTDLEAEAVVNPECIGSLTRGDVTLKVIYKAVDKQWEKVARSAFNLHQNEVLGHYAVPNSVSRDGLEDDYELNLATAPSVEDIIIERENTDENVKTFVDLVSKVIEKAPKIGYAVLLLYTDVKGAEFYDRMRLAKFPANRVRQEAEEILMNGIANFDIDSYKGYKSQYNDVYKEEAYILLKNIVEMIG